MGLSTLADMPRPPAITRRSEILAFRTDSAPFRIGTGGYEVLYVGMEKRLTHGTGANVLSNSAPISIIVPAAPDEMLGAVRDFFGLNVTQTAKVFRVERPTIYLWSSLHDSSKVRTQNLDRMKALFCLAEKCKRIDTLGSEALQWGLSDGTSFLEMISEERIDETSLISTWKMLSSIKDRLHEKRTARNLAFGQAIAASIESLSDKEKLRAAIFGQTDSREVNNKI